MPTDPEIGYRTTGVDTEIPWPANETELAFKGRQFLLLPPTEKRSRSIRVKLESGFPQSAADQLVFELLSAMAWAEQHAAVTTRSTWGTVPIDVGRGPRGITGNGVFDYLPAPIDPKAKLALALYREGLSINFVPYQFLSFFKIINILEQHGPGQKAWIQAHLPSLTDTKAIARVAIIAQTSADVAKYLYESGRCAVAHAFGQQDVVNPDDPTDLIRLDRDLPVVRDLAKLAIEKEFNVAAR